MLGCGQISFPSNSSKTCLANRHPRAIQMVVKLNQSLFIRNRGLRQQSTQNIDDTDIANGEALIFLGLLKN